MSSILLTAIKCKDNLKFKFPYDVTDWIEKMNMMMEDYHKHTTWSNLVQIDSATDVNDFMRQLDSYGCKCMFSGEHGFAGEWLYIYDLCKSSKNEDSRKKMKLQNSLVFRYSTEAYWVKNRHEKDRTNSHIILVAKNYNAIRKINYILSMASIDGFYGKPRIDLDLLFQLTKEDVYVTSACLAGWKYEDAKEIWINIWKHFGDSFFLEYQAHDTPKQKEINSIISQMSREYGIQTIIGLDTHFINDEDRIKRDNLLKRKGLVYDDEDGWYMDFPTGTELYARMKIQNVLSDEEIITSMMNTHVFVNGCEDIDISTDFKIPILEKFKNYGYSERVEFLRSILYEKYKTEDIQTEERRNGIEYELGEIDGSTTADYFLTNQEIINLAVNKYDGHLTTTSRGSASSYYCSKLLGFTTMDRFESEVPIYPERFITKDRILSSHQMPDIDVNVEAQEPFVLASKELLGEHGCYPLLAVGKLGEKSGFKLYADIKGIEPSVANDITSDIDKYNEALKQVDDEEDKKDIHIEDYIDNKYLKVFNDSKPYQGIVEQAKVHACGFLIFNGDNVNKDVIGYGDIRYEIGLIRCHSESTGKSVVVACVEGGLLDSYGYVKDDFLIVDVVGIIYKLYKSIGREVPTVNELRKMVSNDPKVWEMYEIGATCSLNQCEKPSTTKKVMKFKPKSIKELSAFIAGIRPGFKSHINNFIDRIPYTNGEKAIDDLLEDCFNYMLYQEAVMKIFTYLGIPMKDSYDTIKKISKKKLKGEALAKVENNLKEHWLKNIGNLDNFEPVYKVIKDSARYSFNAPHALAMSNDSLYEAWMKAHYTSKFYEVTLNHYQDKGDKNKVALLMKEAVTMFGYTMGTYEFGKDNTKFTVDDETKIIYPNLSSVKGIGEKAVVHMMDIYNSGLNDFIDIYAAIKGTNINSSVFKKLVKIGYFKKFGSIKKLLKSIDIYDLWKGSNGEGRKTISKSNISELGLDDVNIYKYATDITKSGKISDKQFTNVDWIGIVKELVSQLDDEEYGTIQLVKFQYEVLGYVDYVDESLDWRYIVVTDLNTQYSPKFKAYFITNGQSVEMKIHKTINKRDKNLITSFNEIPFEDGDVLYIKQWKKQPKKTKVDGEWVEDSSIIEKWIKDYMKVS